MTTTHPQPDRRVLRRFALTMAVAVGLLFGLAMPLLTGRWPLWPWLFGALCVAWGMTAPLSLRPAYHLWMRFGALMHRVTTPLILGAVFFLVVTPMALVMKLIRRDSMARGRDATALSYRVSSQAAPREQMEKPF